MMANIQENRNAYWIWYPGDFEIYHGMLQNFQREERSYGWPAYWKMDDWRKNICFSRKYNLEQETSFCVRGIGQGYVAINGKKFPMEQWLTCDIGENVVEVYIGNMTGLPCIYVEGDVIYSDKAWMADDFTEKHPVGYCALYEEKEKNPNQVYYEYENCLPVDVKEVNGGVLFDFGRMVNGTIKLKFVNTDAEDSIITDNVSKEVNVYYGESDREALDTVWCYYKQEHVNEKTELRRRAFRYIFVQDCIMNEVKCEAIHSYVPIEVKAKFHCEDEFMNQIWKVSEETFKLCSGLFFIDGIKRDRWIWSGDAYQSYFVNQYLFFDEGINTRTTLALRGNDLMVQHLNTIVDYSLLWLISIENQYWMTGNKEFVELMYPKMEGLMNLCKTQINELGFIYGRERDWIFVDWSDMDKDGIISAEQVLLWKCYETMKFCGELLGKEMAEYAQAADSLKENIFAYFWNEEKGAFIDCYESGKNHVTRHANIFAILFDLVDEKQTKSILENVLMNDSITKITTPYFKFFELDVWGKTGYLDKVYDSIKEYWGGMLKKGAVTFWEDFDPEQDETEQYGMYGDPFGKSLCHAWGASSIYLLGKYFLGVKPLTPGYETFEVAPKVEYFKELDCVVPVKNGAVAIHYLNGELNVTVDGEDGVEYEACNDTSSSEYWKRV